MVTYEYRCLNCGEEFSRLERMEEHGSSHPTCPKCNSDKVRQIFRTVTVKTSKKS